MSGIFVDTSTWRHWFSLRAGKLFANSDQEAEARAFAELYANVVENRSAAPFLYNARIRLELPEGLRPEFDELVKPYARFVPIPLSRCDGAYKADGSLLFGGRMGGSLRCMLSMDGYDHEEELKNAALMGDFDYLYELKARTREFDIELLESALEANAHLFITTDTKRVVLLKRAVVLWPESEAVLAAANLCKLPSAALAAIMQNP